MKITNTKFPNLKLASESDRIDNFFTDFAVSSMLGIILALLYQHFVGAKNANFWFALFWYFKGRYFYYLFFEYFTQQTPGKWLTQTQVVNSSNKKPGLWPIMLRTKSRLIGLVSFITDDEVAVHDAASKTFVVKNSELKKTNSRILLYIATLFWIGFVAFKIKYSK